MCFIHSSYNNLETAIEVPGQTSLQESLWWECHESTSPSFHSHSLESSESYQGSLLLLNYWYTEVLESSCSIQDSSNVAWVLPTGLAKNLRFGQNAFSESFLSIFFPSPPTGTDLTFQQKSPCTWCSIPTPLHWSLLQWISWHLLLEGSEPTHKLYDVGPTMDEEAELQKDLRNSFTVDQKCCSWDLPSGSLISKLVLFKCQ